MSETQASQSHLVDSEMTLPPDSEDEEIEIKKQERIITQEERIMTKEERDARDKKRLLMSGCCVEEAWQFYRGLVGKPRNPDAPTNRPLSVLYDPDVDKRLAFLGQKYEYLLQGLHKIKEAPSKPYIRPQPPRDIDVEGRHTWMPRCARVQMPEVYCDYTHPMTVSAKGTTLKIFNKSFLDDDDINKDAETQTWRRDFSAMSRRWGKKKDWVSCRETPNEDFDLEDHPLDEDGNPVGKSTGQCEWCHGEILPLPTPHLLRNTWDKSILYCCLEYMNCCMEAEEFETTLKAEMENKNRFINVDPHPRVKQKKEVVGEEVEVSESRSANKELAIKDKRREAEAKYNKEKRQKMMLKAVEEIELKKLKNVKNKCVDTYDLPWDPYETRFGHPRFFNNQNLLLSYPLPSSIAKSSVCHEEEIRRMNI